MPATGDASPGDSHWDQRALALVADERLVAFTAKAAALGVIQGMTVTAARAVCADLEARPWDARAIGLAVHDVTAAYLALSPQVSPDRPGLWWIGAHGLEGHGGERALVRALLAQARRWHPDARVAIASSGIAAHVATWLRGAGRIVAQGEDQVLLARAPLALLPMDGELRDTLAALGLTLTGQFASLEAGDVEQRFGLAGLAAWRLAHGDDDRRPTLARPAPDDTVTIELPTPTETLEPVLFLVRAALGRLITQVTHDGMAVAGLEVALDLDRAALPDTAAAETGVRRISLAFPLARLEPLFEQCRATLEGWMLAAPVLGVTVRITERAAPMGEQGDLLHTGWRDPAAAEAAFARLRAALGNDAVVRPQALDGFAPERRGRWDNTPAGVREPGTALMAAAPSLTPPSLRLLHPPERIEVEPGSTAFTWRGRRWPVTQVRDAERLSGDWWSAPYARDYCAWTSEGAAFLVFTDAGAWYLHGWYD